MASQEDDLISVAEAREILGVSHTLMAELIKSGELTYEKNPLDRRSKLLRRADVEALAKRAGRTGKGEAAA
jgi:excisionase family DNA binding protein